MDTSLYRAINRLLFCSLLFAGIASNCQAEQWEPDSKLRFAVLSMVPYGFYDSDNRLSGYLYESALALLQDSQLEHQLSLLPLKRLLVEAQRGQQDCFFIAHTHKTTELFWLVEPIGLDITVGVVPATNRRIEHYEQLLDHRLAMPLGIAADAKLESDQRLSKMPSNGYAHSVELLLAQRVSAIYGNLQSFDYYARQQGWDPAQVFGSPLVLAQLPFLLACRRSFEDKGAVSRLRASVIKLRDQGVFERISEPYLSSPGED